MTGNLKTLAKESIMVFAIRRKKVEFSCVILYVFLIEARVCSVDSIGPRGHWLLTLNY